MICDECGGEIYLEEEHGYKLNGKTLCPDCFREAIEELDLDELAGFMDIDIVRYAPDYMADKLEYEYESAREEALLGF